MNIFNKAVVSFVSILPKSIVRVFSSRYIAGDTLQDAVSLTQEFNKSGIHSTIDVLGESISTKEEAVSAKNQALAVVEAVDKYKLLANISIKPTQFGILLDEEFCFSLVKELVEKAKSVNCFVRLDMEDRFTTDLIIALYLRLRSSYDNVGIVLQAYMRRTLKDIESITIEPSNFRLCKGIYVEPAEVAFKEKEEIRDNFLLTLESIFNNKAYVGIATHDVKVVERSKELIAKLGIPKDRFEFQMLLGVKEDLRNALNKEGFKVRVYVPFGKDWYKYSIRRLKENPNVAGHIIKNIFLRGK